MSFKYKGVMVSLDNYKDIFFDDVYTPDILDEIRSAVLDDTEIGMYIPLCLSDTTSYRLSQVRMSIREYLPKEYIKMIFSGFALHYIRLGVKKGIDMSSLLPYTTPCNNPVSEYTLDVLAKFVYIGTDITEIDFRDVSDELVVPICKGLHNHYPMQLCLTEDMTPSRLDVLIRGMQLGLDIYPFTNMAWSDTQLYLLFSYAPKVDLTSVLPFINYNFDVDSLIAILKCKQAGYSIKRLCLKDSDNYPIYNCYQLMVLSSAIQLEQLDLKMLNPKLSDIDMEKLQEQYVLKGVKDEESIYSE